MRLYAFRLQGPAPQLAALCLPCHQRYCAINSGSAVSALQLWRQGAFDVIVHYLRSARDETSNIYPAATTIYCHHTRLKSSKLHCPYSTRGKTMWWGNCRKSHTHNRLNLELRSSRRATSSFLLFGYTQIPKESNPYLISLGRWSKFEVLVQCNSWFNKT